MSFYLTALEGLAPNLWIFIAHIIAFAIVVAIIIVFAWKPTKKFLQERKKMMSKEIEEAQEKNKSADLLLQEADQKVINAKQQAVKLQELTEEQAHLHWEKTVSKAKNDVDQMRKKALNDIDKMEFDFEKAKKEEITKVALLAAEELMRKKLDAKDNQKLIDSILDEIVEDEQ